ncbi:hypothetical protein CEP54_009921 [Fusarium duplospermum]|uniref:F-box domain-containing protein n=1 Tax=Fusarium duplospermum TaxID=1325734 RepID=A0A428PMT8_9HYPO|nr:hypothetical protein CEP54_009921 [Fusarium duplospermum]
MSLFDKLPVELMVQLLRILHSPLDLRSFLSACPGAYQCFNFHRRHILEPHLDMVLDGLEDEYPTFVAPHIARLRAIQHLLPYLDPAEVKVKVEQIDKLPTPKLAEWKDTLPILCDLFCLASEANDYIARYTLESSRDRTLRLQFYRLLEEHESRRTIFFKFEACRHALFYDRQLLHRIIRQDDDFVDPHGLRSIFRFISAKYHRLVKRVDWHLRAVMLCNGESPTGKLAMSELELDSNRVWQFLQRNVSEESRFVAHLCLQGYGLLIRLEKLDIKQLRHYILTTFLWVLLHEAPDEALGFVLERFYAGVHTSRYSLLLGGFVDPTPGLNYGYSWELRGVVDPAVHTINKLCRVSDDN